MHIKIEVQNSKKIYLNELLENSNIVLQVLIPPTRDPDLEARIQKLKLEQDNKAYRQMTKHIDKIKYHESSSIGTEQSAYRCSELCSDRGWSLALLFGYKGTGYRGGSRISS